MDAGTRHSSYSDVQQTFSYAMQELALASVQCSVQNYFELGQNGRVAEGVAESLPELAELAGLFQFHF